MMFAPCLIHTPPIWALFVHPTAEQSYVNFFAPCLLHVLPGETLFTHSSLLHRFFVITPCWTHTPPFWALFAHPPLLHCLTFAPFLMQTPPFTELFVHPSLQHFFFSPCLIHTPPLTIIFVHQSLLHSLRCSLPSWSSSMMGWSRWWCVLAFGSSCGCRRLSFPALNFSVDQDTHIIITTIFSRSSIDIWCCHCCLHLCLALPHRWHDVLDTLLQYASWLIVTHTCRFRWQ